MIITVRKANEVARDCKKDYPHIAEEITALVSKAVENKQTHVKLVLDIHKTAVDVFGKKG